MSTIKFTKKDVKKYLDQCIEHWRNDKRILKERIKNQDMDDGFWALDKNMDMATFYIDAYQSVRMSLFGELKE